MKLEAGSWKLEFWWSCAVPVLNRGGHFQLSASNFQLLPSS
jgi:hypothetical protein